MSRCCCCGSCCGPRLECPNCKAFHICDNNHCVTGGEGMEHFQNCKVNRNLRPTLRFSANDSVICKLSNNNLFNDWKECVVVETWHDNGKYPYKVCSISDRNGRGNLVPHDCDDYIRKKTYNSTNGKEVIQFYAQHGESVEFLLQVVDIFRFDKEVYKIWLLHNSAVFGNVRAFDALVNECNVDIYTLDEKGRNVIHLAMMGKSLEMITKLKLNDANRYYRNLRNERLLFQSDNERKTVFHYAVLMGEAPNLNGLIPEMITEMLAIRPKSDILIQRDKNNRTALDYSIIFKKPMLSVHLGGYTLEYYLRVVLKRVEQILNFPNTRPVTVNESDTILQCFKDNIFIKGISVDNVQFKPQLARSFNNLIKCLLDYGVIDCLRWLFNESGLQLEQRISQGKSSSSSTSPSILFSSINVKAWISQIYCGPKYWSNAQLFKSPVALSADNTAIALLAFYDICRRHNSNGDFSFVSKFMGTGGMVTELGNFSQDNIKIEELSDFLNTFILRAECKQFNRQIDLICLFLDSFHCDAFVSIYKMVASRQLSLLKHFSLRLMFNFHVPFAQFDPDFCKYTMSLSWMKDDKGVFIGEKHTACKVFCAMAIVNDDYPTFEWLYQKCAEPFEQQGMNHFQFAARMGSYLVTRSLLSLENTDNSIYFAGRFNCFLLALKHNHPHVAELYFNKFGNKKCFGGKLSLMSQYYSLTGSCALTRLWSTSVTRIISIYRRYLVRVKYAQWLGVNYPSWVRFHAIWRVVSREIIRQQIVFVAPPMSWSDLKLKYEIIAVDFQDTLFSQIGDITDSVAVLQIKDVAEDEERYSHIDEGVLSTEGVVSETFHHSTTPQATQQQPLDNIELSIHVLSWLNGADKVLKGIFFKRCAQLAAGDRSYALNKRLKGCTYPMFETKLDSGVRILWTKLARDSKHSIMMWYVSKHDDVSKHLQLIDDSCHRLTRQLSITAHSDSSGSEPSLLLTEDDVLLDPSGNCPLKVYQTTSCEMQSAALNSQNSDTKWQPPLRLNVKQCQVNEESGTVLLLGRSGTGKTICLSDRMTRDRHSSPGQTVRQLFVCRSLRLCEFVRSYQMQTSDDLSDVTFLTLSSFVSMISQNITTDQPFLPENRVEFRRFSDLIVPVVQRRCVIAPSIVWLHIRSFIKGSVEVVVQKAPLTLEQYTDLNVFGADRCRLSMVDRKEVYALYLRYEDVLKTQGLWDDADYTLDLLTRSKLEPLSTQYDKVYVDEVQDNTQAEIVSYFLAAGMNTQSLFLAGDPAQSVVEGVDFRFEDVRSIVYKLSGGAHQIARPIKLLVNYRSHSGVLNCAAAVLDKMFVMFPGAANVLPKDVGLFKGPRPACCQVDGMEGLAKLLVKNERLVVLCADENVERVESQLSECGVKNVVLGIRAAKGLEFQDVILVDSFAHIPKSDYTVWKSLVSGVILPDDATSSPHIELQLKLLYTAVTRSCNRLLFVETEKTQLSSVMFRWLVGAGLAEMYNTADESTVLMTSDEWRVQGIEFALSADGDNSELFLRKSVRCFSFACDDALLERAKCQLKHLVLHAQLVRLKRKAVLTVDQEQNAARVVLGLLRLGLKSEVRELCRLLCDAVANKLLFVEEVLSVLVE